MPLWRLASLTNSQLAVFCGPSDENIRRLEELLDVEINIEDNKVLLFADSKKAPLAKRIIKQVVKDIQNGLDYVSEGYLLGKVGVKDGQKASRKAAKLKEPPHPRNIQIPQPKTSGQKVYLEAMRENDLVFAIGPAGTGKTYLAMARAIEALLNNEVRRIVLTRPAVEAGEKIGFLPGDIQDKLNPFLRPLYDALYDMMSPLQIEEYIESGIIEIAPLAFMRGRTLNHAFIILDEAQNCTSEQMKMFLTRLGFLSKAVVTGDLSQSDLIGGIPVGLAEALNLLKGIKGIAQVELSGKDVVRHELVQKIIEAYSLRGAQKERKQ